MSNLGFEKDESVDAEGTCMINWDNQVYAFGGGREKRQISRVNGNKLERIGKKL